MSDDIFEDVPDLSSDDEGVRRHRRLVTVRPKPKAAAVFDGVGIKTVYWHVIRCPYCKSKKVPVCHTNRPIRYHKCVDCGETFKSVER